MPTVIRNFRGEHREPRLRLPKSERVILENAGGLLQAIADSVAGYHAELNTEATALATAVLKLSELEEHDLTKPW